jgi:DNA-binding PadR family transcriptional regulator
MYRIDISHDIGGGERRMLELAILGLLTDEDLHGYELKRRLTDVLGAFASVSWGSLYPALSRLEKAGAVKAVTTEGDDDRLPPATGSLGAELALFRRRAAASSARGPRNGRSRKVYGITERGRDLFAQLLGDEPVNLDDDREFGLRLALFRFLKTDARVRLLERRRATLVERLARTRPEAGRDTYATALMQHGAETIERDISWLDTLIARERAAATAPIPTST